LKTAGTDLTILRVFDAVVRHGGFAAAQAELNIAPSTISTHIRALEDRLGVTLCQRGREGFELTDQGALVIASARRLFQSLDDFSSEMGDLGQTLVGTLKIGVLDRVVTDPNLHLSAAIAMFKSTPNSVSIDIREDPPHILMQKVHGGEYHFGIGAFSQKIAGLTYEPLYSETNCLYCADKHPLFDAPEDHLTLQNMRKESVASRAYWRDEFVRNLGFENIGAKVDQIDPQLMLILSGHYLGFLPDHVAKVWVAAGRLRALSPKIIRYDIGFDLITPQARKPPRAMEAFLSALRAAQGITKR
jgi:LysR family transcriptional regulator, transcriptional activator for bauABCD operon